MLEDLSTRPILRTPRLVLRPPAAADAVRMAELANDFEVTKMTGGMPFPYTLADAEAFLARAETMNSATDVVFSIDAAGEGLIGGLGFHARGGLGPEVGYWLGQPYWGRGFASEALAAAMAWAKEAWRQRCVIACHFVDNPASGVVLTKTGFLYTGEVGPRPCRARGEDVVGRWMVWLA